MKYALLFSPKSLKQIRKLSNSIKLRIKNACDQIKLNPIHKGTVKIQEYNNIRRKRVGRAS